MVRKLIIEYYIKGDSVYFSIIEQNAGCGKLCKFLVGIEGEFRGKFDDGTTVSLQSHDHSQLISKNTGIREYHILFTRGRDVEEDCIELCTTEDIFLKYIAPAVFEYNQMHTRNKLEMKDVIIEKGKCYG